jgi:hypothetical protein
MSPEEALAILKNTDRELEAPARLETKLIEAFRRRHARRATTRLLGLAALAASMLFYVGRTAGPRPAARPASSVQPVTILKAEQRAIPTPTRVPIRRSMQPPPQEIVTEFFPLMDVAPPLGRGQLLRIAVPASTMRTVGLPVREERLDERVEADVLIGEEGMARAIRFVSLQQ